ncbi:hypothetical protein QQS45_10145 [Alteriqipengyuania flavescens]|nr:hypothetical protein [Alteriqipengyuania flavescens]WJY17984.1 hypothetical protein QQW98_10140 [Alteriqipengyuania flavescens]WJY23925.1 hypothetical protein QQS45_10145 [Alteriqipengyuania flavescens]
MTLTTAAPSGRNVRHFHGALAVLGLQLRLPYREAGPIFHLEAAT